MRPTLRSALVLPVFALTGAPLATAQVPSWLQQSGSSGIDRAWGAAPDGSSGAVFTGYTSGDLFGPSAGDDDVWVSHLDVSGAPLWSAQLGTPARDWGWAAACLPGGDTFVCGETEGALGGPVAGGSDVFVARLGGAGQVVWVQQFGTAGNDRAQALLLDGAGGYFAAGLTLGDLAGPSQGTQDAWLGRFDGAGQALWMRQLGTSGIETIVRLVDDGTGGVFAIAGSTGSLGGVAAGDFDAVVLHLDGAGQTLWSRQIGTPQSDAPMAGCADGSGGLYLAINSQGALAGPNQGSFDPVVVHLGSGGQTLWASHLGGASLDLATVLELDGLGGLLVGGVTAGDLPAPIGGSGPAWFARLDAAGEVIVGSQVGAGVATTGTLPGVSDGAGGLLVAGGAFGAFGGPYAGEFDTWFGRIGFACPPAQGYCSASATSIAGCQAELGASGVPSLAWPDSFELLGGPMPGATVGILVLGTSGPASIPIGSLGGLVCVAGPLARTGLATSGGSATSCSGSLQFTLQDVRDALPALQPGVTVNAQAWARDPANPDGFLLSSAASFDVCP